MSLSIYPGLRCHYVSLFFCWFSRPRGFTATSRYSRHVLSYIRRQSCHNTSRRIRTCGRRYCARARLRDVGFLQDNRPRKVLSLTIAVTARDCYLGEIVVIGKVLRKARELSRVLLLNFISRRRNKTPAANSNVNEHGSENISKIHLSERDSRAREYLINARLRARYALMVLHFASFYGLKNPRLPFFSISARVFAWSSSGCNCRRGFTANVSFLRFHTH